MAQKGYLVSTVIPYVLGIRNAIRDTCRMAITQESVRWIQVGWYEVSFLSLSGLFVGLRSFLCPSLCFMGFSTDVGRFFFFFFFFGFIF